MQTKMRELWYAFSERDGNIIAVDYMESRKAVCLNGRKRNFCIREKRSLHI